MKHLKNKVIQLKDHRRKNPKVGECEPGKVIPAYAFDLKAGFPLVDYLGLTPEEEKRLVKDALDQAKKTFLFEDCH